MEVGRDLFGRSGTPLENLCIQGEYGPSRTSQRLQLAAKPALCHASSPAEWKGPWWMTKRENPKVGKPGHWRRVGPISDRKLTELLWVRPEQWDYERYAPAAR